MPLAIISGTHWGDEGKGIMVDFISQKAKMVIRAQEGAMPATLSSLKLKNTSFILYHQAFFILG